ncbi:MAG: DUF1269 domain-containing protein [Actinobacteria bacterium]|nr:DUF1269 domain-containing protein [Actinomycetota bacterium]
MSDLIVIGYDDEATGRKAYDTVLTLNQDMVVQLEGLAMVTTDEHGKNHVETPSKLVGSSAAFGALWGLLIGVLFFVPVFGLALGGVMGALMGKIGKSGINDQFRKQVNDMMTPGSAAVVIMASQITEDKFADAMKPYGGKLLKTSLSTEDEKELAHELSGQDESDGK